MHVVLQGRGRVVYCTNEMGHRADRRAGRFFVGITGSFHKISFAGVRFATLCVDGVTRLKMIRFFKCNSGASATKRDNTTTYVTLLHLKIGVVCTDGGGEFDGSFQPRLKELDIRHESPPPCTP